MLGDVERLVMGVSVEIERIEKLIFVRLWTDEEIKTWEPNNSWPLSDVQKISEFLHKEKIEDAAIASFVEEALSEDHDGSIMFWSDRSRQIFISRCESEEKIKYFYDEIKYGEQRGN